MSHNLGYHNIQGSDAVSNDMVDFLLTKGINITVGHDAKRVENVALVVRSGAVKDDNVEIVAAKANGIPIIHRAEMLAFIMENFDSIVVSGCHGKTTTTSLLGYLMQSNGVSVNILSGGIMRNYNSNTKLDQDAKWCVVEGDESDGAFALLPHKIGIITNIDSDHLDWYGYQMESLYQKFIDFANSTKPDGAVVVFVDDEHIVNHILPFITHPNIIRYSCDSNNQSANLLIQNVQTTSKGSTFDLTNRDRNLELKDIFVPLFGDHNAQNATAALSALLFSGYFACDPDDVLLTLANFLGVERRLSFHGKRRGCYIFDDYAHHPTEINATLKTLHNLVRVDPFDVEQNGKFSGRITVVFEPHRPSRVNHLISDFVNSFSFANNVVVIETYGAFEGVESRYSTHDIAKLIQEKNPNKLIIPIGPKNNLFLSIDGISKPGDVVIFMGAGHSRQIAKDYLMSSDL